MPTSSARCAPIVTLAFWDSSAFVKLLIGEVGSEDAENVWNDPTPAVASRFVVPEVAAALAAASRGGRLDRASRDTAVRQWRRYQAEVDLVELRPGIANLAADLTLVHPLSGADAVHLATALVLEDAEVIVATWDRRLATAAVAEGLPVIPEDVS